NLRNKRFYPEIQFPVNVFFIYFYAVLDCFSINDLIRKHLLEYLLSDHWIYLSDLVLPGINLDLVLKIRFKYYVISNNSEYSVTLRLLSIQGCKRSCS